MEDLAPGTIAALGGFAGGVGLGFAARWGRFCTLAAIEGKVLGGDSTGLRMWGLAIAVAIIGTYALKQAGLIDISSTFYLTAPPHWQASVAGGLTFGLGMALVGTCGYGTLARIGGGDLKSVVTFLVMGITAYATIGGITAYLRLALFPSSSRLEKAASIAQSLKTHVGASEHFWAYLFAIVLAVACLSSKGFRTQPKRIFTAVLVGGLIVWGWVATGIIADNSFEPHPLESFTFSTPLGQTILYGMIMSGSELKFGIGAVLGVVTGAAITSLFQGHFRWEAYDDAREMRRQILGGFMMGLGSVTALGCTIGQGISAASLLAWSAPITLVSIFAGAWLGLQYLISGSVIEPMRQLFSSPPK